VADVEGRLGLAEVQASTLLQAATSLMEHVMRSRVEAGDALSAATAALAAGVEEKKEEGGKKHRQRRKSTWR
jgi:hypothetical protein